ncbi:odorant receptor Or1-like isoform X2 [Cylas formicarius]|uniref:odorant receptor Or1-like isoform X2 n=1 Tax=Cylas formicarius TaxID=197179 RepID=UPI002958495D|nr:odorant receptor Or1-like isoform X2 [Cylas formicarius]
MIVNINKLSEFTASTYVLFCFSINLVKMSGLYFRAHQIEAVLKSINRNPLLQAKNPKHHAVTAAVRMVSNRLLILGSVLGLSTFLFWSISPFLESRRTLVTNAWYPFDHRLSPNYELTMLHQDLAIAYNIYLVVNTDHFSFNLMMELGKQCEFLGSTLETLDEYRFENGALSHEGGKKLRADSPWFLNRMRSNLVVCIQHYEEVKKLAAVIESFYSWSLLVLFLGGTIILCTLLYQATIVSVSSAQFFMLCFFLTSMLTEQFLFCWFGTEIRHGVKIICFCDVYIGITISERADIQESLPDS